MRQSLTDSSWPFRLYGPLCYEEHSGTSQEVSVFTGVLDIWSRHVHFRLLDIYWRTLSWCWLLMETTQTMSKYVSMCTDREIERASLKSGNHRRSWVFIEKCFVHTVKICNCGAALCSCTGKSCYNVIWGPVQRLPRSGGVASGSWFTCHTIGMRNAGPRLSCSRRFVESEVMLKSLLLIFFALSVQFAFH